jgi:hypothetical protein
MNYGTNSMNIERTLYSANELSIMFSLQVEPEL